MTQIELFQYDQINETDRVYIQDRTIEIKALVKRSAQDIIDIGLKLIEVKERLPHGQWGKWLDSEFGWGQDTAQNFVRVAIKFGKFPNLDGFAQSALYLLASPSTPDEAIDEAIDRAKNGEAITHKAAKGIVTSHKEKFATTKDIKDQKDVLIFPDPKQIPTPLEMANDFAEKEEGYTEEEWNEKPYSYMGDCFKQCYAPGLMVKGEVWEYGVRGVYVCSGCGYAYPPMVEPDKVDLEEYNRMFQDSEDDNETEHSYTSDTIRINARSNNVWYTPPQYIESAKTVLGKIDLDPASSPEANQTISATRIFTEDDNGLLQEWVGKVWLNPPYGRITADFASKLIEEYKNGNVAEAILLINSNVTDTKWFQPLWDYTLCFTDHRINFYSPQNVDASGSTHGSIFVYLGQNTKQFSDEFCQYGAIVRRVND